MNNLGIKKTKKKKKKDYGKKKVGLVADLTGLDFQDIFGRTEWITNKKIGTRLYLLSSDSFSYIIHRIIGLWASRSSRTC